MYCFHFCFATNPINYVKNLFQTFHFEKYTVSLKNLFYNVLHYNLPYFSIIMLFMIKNGFFRKNALQKIKEDAKGCCKSNSNSNIR